MDKKNSKISWPVIFWVTHFVTLMGLLFPLFLLTPIVEGFSFKVFHNIISISEFVVVFFFLGLLRFLLNKFIDWKSVTFVEVLKFIVLTISVGGILQLTLYYLLKMITLDYFPLENIPNMYFGGPELKLIDTVIKIFSWAFAFFTIKMIVNYNAFKLETIALEEKVREEQINIISGRIDAVFMEKSIESIKDLVLFDITDAREALTQLSHVLRYNLTQENIQFVTVGEELMIVKNYLNLVGYSSKKKLLCNDNISPEFLNVNITPIKFLNVIKKAIDNHTVSVSLAMYNWKEDFKTEIKIISSQENKEIELKKESLNTLFTNKEDLELIFEGNELRICFVVFNIEKQKVHLHE